MNINYKGAVMPTSNKFIRKFIILISVFLLSGCAEQPIQKPLTASQKKQIQEINVMQARWHNEEMLQYYQVPGGAQAWKAMNTPEAR